MPYVSAQTKTVMNSDKTAIAGQITVLKAIRKAVPAGVNPQEVKLLDTQIAQLSAVVKTLDQRIKRAG